MLLDPVLSMDPPVQFTAFGEEVGEGVRRFETRVRVRVTDVFEEYHNTIRNWKRGGVKGAEGGGESFEGD